MARHTAPGSAVDGRMVPLLVGARAAARSNADLSIGRAAGSVLPVEARVPGRASVFRGAGEESRGLERAAAVGGAVEALERAERRNYAESSANAATRSASEK